jgi:hypothetical protein
MVAISWYQLTSAPKPLTSQRDNEIRDTLEQYAKFHLVIRQILQILPDKKQDTQPKVWSCTIKAGHNNSLESVMCRPHEAKHS